MTKYDLSILIPARIEEFLSETIDDLLKNKRGATEIIVVLDGAPPIKPLPDHEDLTVVILPESIGQRAAQNLACKLSKAKYVAKTDAHCAFDEGFDVKLMEKMEDDITMVPVMRNLHIFNWRCKDCGMERYQGPEPKYCDNETCQKFDGNNVPLNIPNQFEKHIVWIPKKNPQSSAYRFNKNLQFKYFPELRSKLAREGLQETMSFQGSFFMCTREKYWSLKLCDETWGSWGQQGSEVALKTWLSGGRAMCNLDTWYAHLFRTQQGFSFPYPHSGSDQQKARNISQDIFLNDKWPQAKYPLKWLLNKFWFALKEVQDPDAKWTEADLEGVTPTKGIIYYTDNQLDPTINKMCQEQLLKANLPIVSVSLKPTDFGENYVINMERGVKAYFTQIITALEKSTADIIYFAEHDVLYHPSHFEFIPPSRNKFYYNLNVWRWKYPEDFGVTWDANQVAELCGYRDHLLRWYRSKWDQIQRKGFDRSYEPGGRDENKFENWRSPEPNIDIRHGDNLTKSKWSLSDFRDKTTAKNFKQVSLPDWVKLIIGGGKVS